MKTAYKIIVQGRVQGVGFRWFTLQHAQRLKLKGYVSNLPNGNVEVFVQGDESSLQELILILRKGPSFSYVTNLLINDANFDNSLNNFNVKY